MTGNDNDDGMMLSRRDAIRGGAALGTMALASRIGAYAQVVEAQITEPRIQLGSDYAIHDNGGNLVINHDPNGDILEYDATADQITTLKPLSAVTTESLAIGTTSTFLEGGSFVPVAGGDPNDPLSDTTSTTYEDVGRMSGKALEVGNVPNGVTLYGRFVANFRPPSGSDSMFVRPAILGFDPVERIQFSELELSSDNDNTLAEEDTGWTEITTGLADNLYLMERIEAKVDGGTGEFPFAGDRVSLLISWRIDD